MELLLLLVGIVVGWLGASALEYAKTKGKNFADKEDIQQLTRLVEDVKHENALILENAKGRHQLRLAALDRRLQAHQEAFALWRKLIRDSDEPSLGELVAECQRWWEQNCLYLSADAREAFNRAYHCAASHKFYRNAGDRDAAHRTLVQQNWSEVIGAGDILVRAVDLPSLGDAESKDVSTPSDGGSAPQPLATAA